MLKAFTIPLELFRSKKLAVAVVEAGRRRQRPASFFAAEAFGAWAAAGGLPKLVEQPAVGAQDRFVQPRVAPSNGRPHDVMVVVVAVCRGGRPGRVGRTNRWTATHREVVVDKLVDWLAGLRAGNGAAATACAARHVHGTLNNFRGGRLRWPGICFCQTSRGSILVLARDLHLSN